ncbi:MAG: GIY-YIG nuclease family protein [Saprospiraceae bacterium]|nr:GIY-YIG nuclease family protein [Saprospiraceae bacterium]MCB9322310.1 GIY-YIG nuclease family protein [Lewinellaceae bacterium]
MFHTYIIHSLQTDQLYIGQTNDLDDRIIRHNTNRNKWTKNKGPWVLIFSRPFESRSKAVQLERKLKGFKNRERILAWIEKNKEAD